jgi:hypothetical protein
MTEFVNSHPVTFWSAIVITGILLTAGFAINIMRGLRRAAAGENEPDKREGIQGSTATQSATVFFILVFGLASLGMLVGILLPVVNFEVPMRIGGVVGGLAGFSLFNRFVRRLRRGGHSRQRNDTLGPL